MPNISSHGPHCVPFYLLLRYSLVELRPRLNHLPVLGTALILAAASWLSLVTVTEFVEKKYVQTVPGAEADHEH